MDGGNRSIRGKLRLAFITIIVLMVIPAIGGVVSMTVFSRRYAALIDNIASANALMAVAENRIANEMWDIVSGKKAVSEGRQAQIIETLRTGAESLARHSSSPANDTLMEVTERTLLTLENYVTRLEHQVTNRVPVDENLALLEEIRGVSALTYDLIQQYNTEEITSVAGLASAMNRIIEILTWVEFLLVLFISGLAYRAVVNLISAIRKPIINLERHSVEIAEGNLSARAGHPGLEELVGLTGSLNTMTMKLDTLMREGIAREKNLRKAESKALQAQITPHFLYNTLDTIIGLAEADRKDDVVDITKSLAAFFRTALSKGRDFITVEKELTHVRSYLEIQKMRYRDTMDYEIDVEESLYECSILKILLQPLVENALYHGIKPSRRMGLIRIQGRRSGEMMEFSVVDSGVGMNADTLGRLRASLEGNPNNGSDSGYGLYNVDSRIKLFYGSGDGLVIDSEENGGCAVSFRLPAKGGILVQSISR